MLTFLGHRSCQTNCAGVTRRDFLQVGALGHSGLTLPGLLRAQATTSTSPDTSVVFLWLEGGAPQTETFDPKPGIPEEYRSVTGEIQTRLPGVMFGGLLPKLADVADKMSIVRTLTHGDPNHPGATHWVRTGYAPPVAIARFSEGRPDRPTVGSVLARVRGATHPPRAERPRTRPVTPQDLMATLFRLLGLDLDMHPRDTTGRPVALIESGQPIMELL